jgi:para-aminobenzoate synthetase/4-amino-4-deoxychorismate lyase
VTARVVVRDASAGRWLELVEPVREVSAWRTEEVVPALAEVERAVEDHGLWAAGLVSYEAAPAFDRALAALDPGEFPLLWIGLFDRPHRVQDPTLQVAADDVSYGWKPSLSQREYADAVSRIRELIRAGDTYQVNFTYRLRAPFDGDPWAFFTRIAAAQGPSYAAFVDLGRWCVCSASPELFLRRAGHRLTSRPMKGTARRGLSALDDRAAAAALTASQKDRAENLMIVDMVRNDLGRIAETGSVTVPRFFEVERYPTVWQATSTVECESRAGLVDVLRATFPPASITGAPKPRTMQVIAELEHDPRRVYTGTVGFLAPGRSWQLNVAIRTVLVDRERGSAEYGVGSGVVWDSDPSSEMDECRTKARVLSVVRPQFSLLETLLWAPEEGYVLLPQHLERLAESAAYFGFRLDGPALLAELDRRAERFAPSPLRVRVLLDRDGQVSVTESRQPEAADARLPVRCVLCPFPVQRDDVFLYHKTTCREVYERAAAACPGFDDVILWNEAGEVTESCTSNVVVEIGGDRVTPPIHCGLLPGTYRRSLLESGQLRERALTVEDLRVADRILLVNSVRGERVAMLEPVCSQA